MNAVFISFPHPSLSPQILKLVLFSKIQIQIYIYNKEMTSLMSDKRSKWPNPLQMPGTEAIRRLASGVVSVDKTQEQWSATKENLCLLYLWSGYLYRAKILLLIPALVVWWLAWTVSFTQSRITWERSIRGKLPRLCYMCLQEGCPGYSNQCGKTHLHCECGHSLDQGSWVT